MLWIRTLYYKLGRLLRPKASAEDLEAEIRVHLELEAEQLRERGVPEADARAAARRKFGSPAIIVEDSRRFWGFRWWDELAADLKYALRAFRKDRGFVLTGVAILALGLGITSACFALLDAVLLRPLRYRDPDRLVMLWSVNEQRGITIEQARKASLSMSLAEILAWRDRSGIFESLGAFHMELRGHLGKDVGALPIDIDENATPAIAGFVAGEFFETLGVTTRLGRTFRGDRTGVILQNEYWTRVFHADPSVIGQSVRQDRPAGKQPGWPVLGVMPPGFVFLSRTVDYFLPVDLRAGAARPVQGRFWVAVGRLPQNVSLSQAQSRADAFYEHLGPGLARSEPGWEVRLVPVKQDAVGEFRPAMLILLGAAALLLLTVFANAGNLQLVRATSRVREMALRATLGASRARLMKQLVTESLVITIAGGVCGLGLAHILVRAFGAALPNRQTWGGSFLPAEVIRMDGRVIAFALASAIVIGLVLGVVPLLGLSAANFSRALKDAAHGVTTARGRRLRSALIVAEVSFAVILVTGAGLLLRSFFKVYGRGPGFDSRDRLLISVRPTDRYLSHTMATAGVSPTDAARAVSAGEEPYWNAKNLFRDAILSEIRRLPGVIGVTAADRSPLDGDYGLANFVIRSGASGVPEHDGQGILTVVEPNYFSELGIPLLRGRAFSDADRAGGPLVAVVSQEAARRFWPGQDPIGRQLKPETPKEAPALTVVGVAGDVFENGIHRTAVPVVYQPWQQNRWWHGSAKLIVHTAGGDPLALVPPVRRSVESLDADASVTRIFRLSDLVRDSAWRLNYATMCLVTLALLSFLLTLAGIFGVLSYTVRERTRELGIRMALGARRAHLIAMVLRQAFANVLAGIAIGVLGSLLLSRSLSSLLFGVSHLDAVSFVVAAAGFVPAALLASYLPAKHAISVDPMTALRFE
jgi:putative ABC transport system permease protein